MSLPAESKMEQTKDVLQVEVLARGSRCLDCGYTTLTYQDECQDLGRVCPREPHPAGCSGLWARSWEWDWLGPRGASRSRYPRDQGSGEAKKAEQGLNSLWENPVSGLDQ